jgi:hypothetical protein
MTTEPVTTDSSENSAEVGIDVQRLVRLFSDFEDANQGLEPLDTMLGVTPNGRLVLGGLLPSGKLIGGNGDEEDCPWRVNAKAVVTLISLLKQEFDKANDKAQFREERA